MGSLLTLLRPLPAFALFYIFFLLILLSGGCNSEDVERQGSNYCLFFPFCTLFDYRFTPGRVVPLLIVDRGQNTQTWVVLYMCHHNMGGISLYFCSHSLMERMGGTDKHYNHLQDGFSQ